ncbi:uncharacterized protein LOC111081843 [Drosophila obscura]|uniref:uncharacterized protein LOC111081843 n=1 Tax=Drosophila obscura TaxID=7282 RepID=UPI001BB2584E|nr:uncharacterized protein LOC111081843 [Drosophila obscura]
MLAAFKAGRGPRTGHSGEMRSQLIGLLLVGLGLSLARARPQNPLENLALGAMNVAANVAEAVQGGAAINRDFNVDNPLMSVHSKTAAGFGDAMRPPSGGDSSESEERRRRRRRRSLQQAQRSQRSQRIKRAPCHWKMTMPTEPAGEDEVEARKKRARKRAANNASRSRITPKKSTKKKKLLRRRRQQPSQQAGGGQQQQQAAASLGDRLKGMWLTLVDNVADAVQQMQKKITSAAGAAAAGRS